TDIKKVLNEVLDERISQKEVVEKTYSINQVAKMLGRSHKKISDLVASGILKTTPDNRIFESSIREYTK
ncbi:helix-turn-helix domain-containing protein, partial [Bacteroides fragilis]